MSAARAVPRLRSALFAPGNRPDLIDKLPRSGPDAVVLDLEDAVAVDAKAAARSEALAGVARLADAHPALVAFVRVNAVSTPWFADDIAAVAGAPWSGVLVPKVESAAEFDTISEALDERGASGTAVVAGIESAAGVLRVEEIAARRVLAVYFGAEDFIADMGGDRTRGNDEVAYARARVVLAAKAHGIVALDQIVASYDDEERFVHDATQGRNLGYDGKVCIHPAQVAWANRVFSPSDEEVQRARALLAALERATGDGSAVISFEGRMVDEPMARRARAVLDAAEQTVTS